MIKFMGIVLAMSALSQSADKGNVDLPPTQVDAISADYELVHGKWERVEQTGPFGVFGSARLVKEIDSEQQRERVTHFDSEGNVVTAHEVDFRLDRGPGPTRVFTFTNLKHVKGPHKGQSSEASHSYLWHVKGDRFVEVWGMLVDDGDRSLEVIEWRRVKEDDQ